MIHHLAQNGVICINLGDYGGFPALIHDREKIDYLAVKLNCPKEISHCLITIMFHGGQSYYLSNLYLCAIPDRIGAFYNNYTSPNRPASQSKDYLLHFKTKYDVMQIPVIQIFELHYQSNITFAMVRQCDEYNFINEVSKNKKIADPKKFYQKMRDDFDAFISDFNYEILPEIITSMTQEWLLILSDSELRKGMIIHKSFSQNIENITQREWQCLHLSSTGLTIKEISDHLSLSTETVKTHAKSIRRKMNCANLTEAVSKAFRIGLLS